MYDEVIQVSADQVQQWGWVKTHLGDGQSQYLLTGVLIPTVKGGGDWRKVTIRATIPLPDLGAGQTFTATQWAPTVSLAAVATEAGDSVSGWAVDGCSVVGANAPQTAVTLDVQAACRDVSSFLLRVTYSIVIVGS